MRVRFAPSPTGFLHIGNARTAILNYLLAKKYSAELVLRVEDTDTERSTLESEQSIYADLKWLGLEWTEGPDVGGECGPYRQSERFDIYKEYTDKLLAESKAYYCYCSQAELDEMRDAANKEGKKFVYPGKCRNLSDEERKKYEREGRKPTIRFCVPENEEIEIKDHIKGSVTFNSSHIGGDFIIVRSDGGPIYNYIVVIDDALMKITHVIRGEDHLSNAPKQIMIARALGFADPEYAHMPLIMGDDKKKLSKRHGITSVNLYKEQGYLPEALVNYIAMLGWASESGEEVLSLEQIIKEIDLDNLAKSSAVFDFKKLRWMNGIYIRNYDLEKITALFMPYIEKAGYDLSSIDQDWLLKVIDFIRIKCEVLADIGDVLKMFLEEMPEPAEDAEEQLKSEAGLLAIQESKKLLDEGLINEQNFADEFINLVKEKSGLKGKNLFMSCRAVLTSNLHGPDLAESLKLIGFEKCVKRINNMFEKYAG
jgi:glutamyl-tRNA synthetase